MRNSRFSVNGLTRAPERVIGLMAIGFSTLTLAASGCESSGEYPVCTIVDAESGEAHDVFASDYDGDVSEAASVCQAALNAATEVVEDEENDDGEVDDTDDTDDVTGSDYDGDNEADGYEDPVMVVGAYVYAHISIMPSGAEEYFLFGYGFTGTNDWCEERHKAEKVLVDGQTWWRSYLVNYGDEYRVNFGTEDVCSSGDFTRWAYLEGEAKDDPFAWQSEKDDSWSLCATHDGETLVPGDCDNNDDE